MNFDVVAKSLKGLDKNIILIFAFNGVGKTQLSVAYKNVTKADNNGQHAGVYYNAYSEDLFVWDNDEENDGANIKLKVLYSSLNKFHSFLYDDQDAIKRKLAQYNPTYNFRLNPYEDLEKGIESITFLKDGAEETPIKISRGEERIFVWCFFLALLDVDGWAKEQDAHIFIDDPVSSLDEHNIFITANTLFQQVEQHYKKKRIIITTHHIGLFSILKDKLQRGEKSERFKNLTETYFLKRTGDSVELSEYKNSVPLYHLHLLQLLDDAIKIQLFNYHFVLLRQVLENISSFQGSGRPSRVLSKIGFKNSSEIMDIINSHSHKTPYYFQSEMMNETDAELFESIFSKLITTYHLKLNSET